MILEKVRKRRSGIAEVSFLSNRSSNTLIWPLTFEAYLSLRAKII